MRSLDGDEADISSEDSIVKAAKAAAKTLPDDGHSDGGSSHTLDHEPMRPSRSLCPQTYGKSDLEQACSTHLTVTCQQCELIAYCSETCRGEHWATHKTHCPQGEYEDDMSAKGGSFPGSRTFWAQHAAIDVLNLEKNEGIYFDDFLNTLLNPDFGVRHLIYTIVKLPKEAKPVLNFTICENNMKHLSRTLVGLLLLLGQEYDKEEAVLNAEAVIHLWYSSKMTPKLFEYIASSISCYTVDLENHYYKAYATAPAMHYYMKLHEDKHTLSLGVTRDQWSEIEASYHPSDMSSAELSRSRMKRSMNRRASHQRFKETMNAGRASAAMKWERDGVLLPWSASSTDYTLVNPMLVFKPEDTSAFLDEPFTEWPMEMLDQAGYPCENDYVGKMFFYLRDLLVEFQARAQDLTLFIDIRGDDLESAPLLNKLRPGYDRIELGHGLDSNALSTLTNLTSQLRHEDENPFATAVGISRLGVTTPLPSVQKDLVKEISLLHKGCNPVLDALAPPVSLDSEKIVSAVTRRQKGLLLWRNWDKFFDHYLKTCQEFAFVADHHKGKPDEQRNVIASGYCGVYLRAKQTITKRWPTRLVHGGDNAPTAKEFERWLAWGDNQPERWLEWRRSEDMTQKASDREAVLMFRRKVGDEEAKRKLASIGVDIRRFLSDSRESDESQNTAASTPPQNTPEKGSSDGGDEKPLVKRTEDRDDEESMAEKPEDGEQGTGTVRKKKTKRKGKKKRGSR